ncbi:NAC domain-containing protein 19-like [Argentina anserina]|uniref:NAC domain-containing protein 19-like n=1 Tax=Argentina anserina TaxID=57926 RepID=UPI0021768859|nr:NAC domain-containing protein 19-like [Potentilla anserina]
MKSFPIGFRFHPTDDELVSYYLRNKAQLGDEYRSSHVPNCPEFYGKSEPWTIWDKYGGHAVEDGEPLFFFAKRKRLNPKSSRFDRKVGTGTWSGQYRVKVMEEGKVIGVKRDFRYERGSSADQNNRWLMDEYELNKNDITVLCTLRKNPTNPPPKTDDPADPSPETHVSETVESTVDESRRKRKFDDFIGDLEQDLDQRRKLIADLEQRRMLRGNKQPRTEGTSWVEQGGHQ